MVLSGVAAVTPGGAAPTDGRFAYTDSFAQAKMFKSDCVGFACAPTEEFSMARRAARDDRAIVPYLEQRYQQAPRAGQLYIALVIRAHDKAKGEALLRQLAQAKGETVDTFFGCIMGPHKLDQLAGEYLQRSDFNFD
jgi:hypothetical protein